MRHKQGREESVCRGEKGEREMRRDMARGNLLQRQQHNKLIICNINNSSPDCQWPHLSPPSPPSACLLCGMSWAWASISSQRWRCTTARSAPPIAHCAAPSGCHSWRRRARTNKGRGMHKERRRGRGWGNSLACVGHCERRDGASLGWGPGQARPDGPVKQAIHPSAAGRQQLQAARRCEYANKTGSIG